MRVRELVAKLNNLQETLSDVRREPLKEADDSILSICDDLTNLASEIEDDGIEAEPKEENTPEQSEG